MALHLHYLSSISQPVICRSLPDTVFAFPPTNKSHSCFGKRSGSHLKNSSMIRRFPVKSMNQRPLFRDFGVKAFFFNPTEEPILKEALKEPVAFMGGMFAGLLRLDLNEDPLKEWVTRTVEASGITEEIGTEEGTQPEEESPQQIEIE